jgi:hypothetical protein
MTHLFITHLNLFFLKFYKINNTTVEETPPFMEARWGQNTKSHEEGGRRDQAHFPCGKFKL